MMKMLYRILLLSWCMLMSSALPIESKPLNNNPESWNLSWLVFEPKNSADPSAEALISGNDPHVKKSKITPKSIFIAPSAYNNNNDRLCPHGYRVDDNGKCIKTVKINQDDILAARLSDLFGNDDNSDKDNDDSDYYDFDEDKKEDSGPLQINLPLSIDIQEETHDGKKVEYIVEEKYVNMRNLNPKNAATEEITTIVPAPVTEKLTANDISTTVASSTTTEIPIDDLTTTTLTNFEISTDVSEYTIVKSEIEELITTTESVTTSMPTTTTTTTTTTTEKPVIIMPSSPEPFKINSVEFMPKITQRKSNRNRSNKNSRTRRPKPSPLAGEKVIVKAQSVDQVPVSKKNRTRSSVKRRKPSTLSTTTTTTTTTTSTTIVPPPVEPLKPHYWLPKGWTIDETTKEKPVLIRFWSEQPLPHDERGRSHNSRYQRVNSRMPTENIFREMTVPELEGILKEKK